MGIGRRRKRRSPRTALGEVVESQVQGLFLQQKSNSKNRLRNQLSAPGPATKPANCGWLSLSPRTMMFRATRLRPLRLPRSAHSGLLSWATFGSTSINQSLPKAPLHLDPSLEALLRDVDISLKNAKTNPEAAHRELEVVFGEPRAVVAGFSPDEWSPMEMDEAGSEGEREHRKSPAARFGSEQIGTVIIPTELRSAVDRLIAGGFHCFVRINHLITQYYRGPEVHGT